MSDWYYSHEGQQQGPVSGEAMQRLAQAGGLLREDMVWRDGMSRWAAAGSVPNLFPPEHAPLDASVARWWWLLPVGRSGWALVAGYLGVCSILLAPAPLAIVAGIMALVDLRRHPERLGTGRAFFGLVMGIFGTVGLGLALFVILRR